MKLLGRLAGLQRDFKTGKPIICLAVENAPEALSELSEKDLKIEIKPNTGKRSLDANAYYWALLSQLGDKLRVSKAYLHNMMLRRYGQPELYGEKMVYVVIPDTEEAQKQAEEDEYTHLKPTSEIRQGRDGNYRTYILLRGSHSYNSQEMAALINGLVDECSGLGIETLTPEERLRFFT